MRRFILVLLAFVFLTSFVAGCDSDLGEQRVVDPGTLEPYEGLGTWVDVYDYVPGFQDDDEPPPVTPDSIDDMAALGVDTLYLQAAQDDERISGATVDEELLGEFLVRAHEADVQVVAWYLPRFVDVAADLARIEALHDFRVDGQRFDGLALDIEWTLGVPDVPARNDALVSLSEQVRELVGERYAVGAIVLEPVLLEVVNPAYWPTFPWSELAPLYDVWMPMSYWTNRSSDSGFREGFAYTDENVRRLRANLDDDDAFVHTIGGIGNDATAADYEGFVRASEDHDALGWSVYDYNTVASSAWPRLRDS